MDLKALQQAWDGFGRTDPLWAIIAWPEKKGGRWEKEAFFQMGIEEVDGLMDDIEMLGVKVRRKRVLDFGCGVGRVTQALADHFEEVCGLDIAPSMLALANQYNRHGNRCRYVLNEYDHMRMFPSDHFDCIYSHLTLQHIEPRYTRRYIQEFCRILAPEGLLVFQQTDERVVARAAPLTRVGWSPMVQALLDSLRRRSRRTRRSVAYESAHEIHGIARWKLIELLKVNGMTIVDIRNNQSAGPEWVSYLYFATKG